MSAYPQIEKLKSFFNGRTISFEKLASKNNEFFLIRFSINKNYWDIYIDDECGDYNENNPLICLYLTLLALDTYKSTDDYLNWCHQYNIDSSELNWLDYFKELETTFHQIESELGVIDPCLSDYDYSLRTGVVDALLASN